MGPCAQLQAGHSLACPVQRVQRCNRAARLVVRAGGSSFGTLFRVTTFGESHGKGVGCVVDGIPPRLPITKEEIQAELDRRRPGQSRITTPRKESDTCEIYSGALQLIPDLAAYAARAYDLRNSKVQRCLTHAHLAAWTA